MQETEKQSVVKACETLWFNMEEDFIYCWYTVSVHFIRNTPVSSSDLFETELSEASDSVLHWEDRNLTWSSPGAWLTRVSRCKDWSLPVFLSNMSGHLENYWNHLGVSLFWCLVWRWTEVLELYLYDCLHCAAASWLSLKASLKLSL